MRPYLVLLSRRPARRYFAAYAQSSIGTGLGYIALTLLAYGRFHSGWAVSAVLLGDFLPSMVLGALLGAVLDRLSRRTCAIAGDLLCAGAFVGLVVAHSLVAVTGLALLAGVGSALNIPAVMAAMPSLVADEDMPAATALYNALEKFGFVVGPLIGSLLLIVSGTGSMMAVNAVTFLVSAALTTTIPFGAAAPRDDTGHKSLLADARAGLAAARSLPGVTTLVSATGATSGFFGAYITCEVIFATGTLHVHGAVFSAVRALMSAAMTFGALGGARAGGVRCLRSRYLQGMVCLGAGMATIALSTSLPLLALGFVLAGYGNGRESVHDRLLVTALVPDAVRGRVFSLRYSLLCWAAGTAYVITGGLVSVIGARAVIAAAAGGTLLTWSLASWRLGRRPAVPVLAAPAPSPQSSTAVI